MSRSKSGKNAEAEVPRSPDRAIVEEGTKWEWVDAADNARER